jgi:hypothetical protein
VVWLTLFAFPSLAWALAALRAYWRGSPTEIVAMLRYLSLLGSTLAAVGLQHAANTPRQGSRLLFVVELAFWNHALAAMLIVAVMIGVVAWMRARAT